MTTLLHLGQAVLFFVLAAVLVAVAFNKPRRWFVRVPLVWFAFMAGLGCLVFAALVGIDTFRA